jgi:hypothetical protein
MDLQLDRKIALITVDVFSTGLFGWCCHSNSVDRPYAITH